MTLVNYFGAVDKQSNPGAGVTYPYLKIEQIDARYWEDRNKEYLARLKAVGGADGKGLDQRAKDLLGDMKKGVQASSRRRESGGGDGDGRRQDPQRSRSERIASHYR